MRAPLWLFVSACVCGVVVIVLVGRGETSPLIWFVAAAGTAVSLAGGAVGRPQVVFAGAVAMLGGFGFTLSTGSSGAIDTLFVALLLWGQVEFLMRSMELRRTVAPTTSASVSWMAAVIGVAAGTALLWMIVAAVAEGAPSGGLLYRMLAVAAVVVVAMLVSGIPIRRDEPTPPGRLPG